MHADDVGACEVFVVRVISKQGVLGSVARQCLTGSGIATTSFLPV